MKMLLGFALVLSVFGVSSSAFAQSSADIACDQYEAQFSGVVTEVNQKRSTNGEVVCRFKAQALTYNVSWVCPLPLVTLNLNYVVDSNCSKSVGDEVSGILVLRDGVIRLEK